MLLTALAGLLVIFLAGSLRPVNMGAVALVAAFLLTAVSEAQPEDIFAGFPVDLLVILVGVTYLFGFAHNNGSVDWILRLAVAAVRGNRALVPWIMFAASAVLAGIGAASPAAVAIVAPVGIAFAVRHGTSPLLAGLMAVNGAAAGSFSPLGVLGGIALRTAERSGARIDAASLLFTVLGFNFLIALVTVAVFRKHGVGATGSAPALAPRTRPTAEQVLTLTGILLLIAAVTFLKADAGLVALTASVVLALLFPATAQDAAKQIAWPIVLLACGIVTYVAVLERIGVIRELSNGVEAIGSPVLAALVVCLIGAVVSAFASTTGILGALVPLSVPLLVGGDVHPGLLLAALCVSASVVDASPFSTNGALVVATVPEAQRAATYRALLLWGAAMVVAAPLASWAVLVLPQLAGK
ncbi:SLC13 family permease [Saccharopolyspora taberi]|uniref:SLC13 family permease n=1 Tax=Saccharopolyspora taberi TaxID=60895 RepID=A0ABN3VIL8_9PSEU